MDYKTLIGGNIYNMADQPQQLRNEIPELKNFEDWVKALLEFEFKFSYLTFNRAESKTAEVWNVTGKDRHLYPDCILNHAHELAVEFRYLLPETLAVKAVLPVLLVGYIKQWKNHSKRNRSDYLLSNLVCGKDDATTAHYKANVNGLFKLTSWDEAIKSLKYTQVTLSRLKEKISPFGTAILFLFLAYKTQDLCNLTLSCSLFEEYTGCLGLLGLGFLRYSESEFDETADPLRSKILSILEKIFDANSDLTYTILDMYMMNFTIFLAGRDIKGDNDNFEEFCKKNSWAYECIYEPYFQYCSANRLFLQDGKAFDICDDEMIHALDISHEDSTSVEFRKRIESEEEELEKR